ncbi:hypothetical protein LOTGIDRAFT_174077 [Lottia gigantea]|uniref:Uncharacterized protein n=1 Tax=Lottia gigantea TaxID=225164 RepID=V4A418_LOTGI|nr:hypothetical protein LOTGIDRAFT_174077 [Lottia gigantea]ESO98658.1 hypothetical protein LOTGIDRAFT_174077 [Lottia gigantea]
MEGLGANCNKSAYPIWKQELKIKRFHRSMLVLNPGSPSIIVLHFNCENVRLKPMRSTDRMVTDYFYLGRGEELREELREEQEKNWRRTGEEQEKNWRRTGEGIQRNR